MKKKLLLLAFIGLVLPCYSQTAAQYDFAKFTPLQSSGTLPEEVEMTGKDFMSTTRKNLTKGGSKKDKKAKESFVLQTSYAIKDLFISGRLLYNDPISDYVEKVRREVTASDPQLASETKVFVVKSSVVNAFATNQGYLFITTGLLAQLENEAQLAFVLCHELIHYKKKHVIKAYVQNDKIDRGEGGYRKSEVDKKYLAKSNYSKEHESEADVNGFDLFAKTRYSLDAINGTFDVLKYSELPFEDFEFNHKILESEFLVFPIDYIQQEVTVVEGEDEDEDDKTSTHPNLAKRRTDIADKISSLEGEDKDRVRSNYAISEDLFLNTRKLARFDLCHTNLINRQYDRALYQAYCLLKENPDNIYLNKVILKSLYGLTKYANSKRVREVSVKYSKVQGESQKLNYMLDKLESNELNVVALNFAWRLKTKLRHNDTEVNLITEDIFYEMVKRHYPNKSAFSLEARTTPVDTTRTPEAKVDEPTKTKKKTTSTSKKKKDDESASEDDEDTPKQTKTSKLKKKKKVDEKNYFVTYAFVDLLKDKDFVDTYDRLSKQTKKDKTTEKKELSKRKSSKNKKNKKVDDDDDDFDDEENQYLLDEKESVGKYNGEWDTYALGVDKVLIVNPFYLKIDERKKNPVSYSGSEDAQKDFNKKLLEMSSKTGLDVEILDKQEFNSGSVDNYNDMGVLIDWMDERIDHKKLKMLPTDYLRVDDITKKYGTEYLTLMGTINFIEKKRGIGWAIFATIYLFPFSLPFTIPYFINKRSHTYVYTVVFNLKTGQTEMVKIGHAPLKDRYDVMNSFIYDYLQQIKRTGKSKNF
jgi:Zn-dependent protease with chaperone function